MPQPYSRVSQTMISLPDGRVLEIYITLHAPLPMASGRDGDLWADDDPPLVANHVYQTIVWHDIANGITDRRIAQDLTLLEIS